MARMTLEEALAASLVREEPDAIQDEVLEEIPEKEPDPMEQMLLAVGEPPEEITEPVERCVIDGWTRKITVPNLYAFIGIESDEKTMRIPFRCPRIVGNGTDLSKMHIYVNYQNANGEKNRYLAEDVTIDGDDILFSWELSRHVTMYKGFVSYIICAKKGDTEGNTTNEWNTHVAQGMVDEGFEVINPAEIEEHDFDIIEQLLLRMDRVEDYDFVNFEILDDGHLWLWRMQAIEGALNFELNENGELEVIVT